jgi:hypothetical protein
VTTANLASIGAFQFGITGCYDDAVAAFTKGAGQITYTSNGCTAVQFAEAFPWTGGSGAEGTDTGENSNVTYGPLPWPWSISMVNNDNSGNFVQDFVLTTGPLPPEP